MKRISTASLVMVLGFAWTTNQAMAQQGERPQPQSFVEISARIERQDQQIRQLQAQMSGAQQGAIATPTAFAPSSGTLAAPVAPAASQGYEVGSDLNVTANFMNGAGLIFATPNKDFSMHLGGWFQYDNVWWNQSTGMATTPGTQTRQGVAPGGIGPLEDGDQWRRVRLVMEGNFWETYLYRFNFAFENIQYSTCGLDEFWIGNSKIPVIGTVRAGHVKAAVGLEGDMQSSSRCMTFMERSAYSESIELNQSYGNGLWFNNSYLDDRLEWTAAAFRPDNANSGDFYGTGEWGAQARVSGLPLYEDEGRHLLHLGVSGGWRNGTNSAAGSPDYVQLRARPELKDDDPAASPTGGQALPDANSNRMIDTGKITCNQEYLLCLEELYIRGPFSLQAEYGWNFLNNAQIQVGTPKPISNYVFNGGYLQAAYTLTGENRAYDKKTGTLNRNYFGDRGPYENAFLVRDADGNLCSGWGAWEIACRYSYVDLNAGSGAAFVNGGIMNGVSVGLNWYLNTNLTVMNECSYNSRYDLPGNGTNPGTKTTEGSTAGFGTRVQLSF